MFTLKTYISMNLIYFLYFCQYKFLSTRWRSTLILGAMTQLTRLAFGFRPPWLHKCHSKILGMITEEYSSKNEIKRYNSLPVYCNVAATTTRTRCSWKGCHHCCRLIVSGLVDCFPVKLLALLHHSSYFLVLIFFKKS